MIGEYTFESGTVDGSSVVLAEPVGDDANSLAAGAEAVPLSSAWTTDGAVEGAWEDAVRAVLDAALFGSMTVEAGSARLDASTAIETLVEASADSSAPLAAVTGEGRADALVAYLDSVGVWTLDDGDVVVLRDPRTATLTGRESLAWAGALDVCIDRIDEMLEEFEDRDGDAIEDARNRLASVRAGLQTKESEIRIRAIQQRSFPDDATAVAGRFSEVVAALAGDEPFAGDGTLDDVVAQLAGVGAVERTVENTSEAELVQMVEDELPELDDVVDGADGSEDDGGRNEE